MRNYTVIGGGGVKLRVVETGNPRGKPIIFIHGFSQCHLAWSKQLNSMLAQEFRLVAMDLRGHGESDKPRDEYADSQAWADDVYAVLEVLELDKPVLTGWSYGGVVISDYVKHYGEQNIAGTNWVTAISRLGEPLLAAELLGANFLALIPGFFSSVVDESVAALEQLIRLCVVGELSAEERYLLLGFNLAVPPHVREALLSRNVDNDAVVSSMRKPILLTYGEEDAIVLPAMSDLMTGLAPRAKLSAYADAGHAPFWDAADRFNRELQEFRRSV